MKRINNGNGNVIVQLTREESIRWGATLPEDWSDTLETAEGRRELRDEIERRYPNTTIEVYTSWAAPKESRYEASRCYPYVLDVLDTRRY